MLSGKSERFDRLNFVTNHQIIKYLYLTLSSLPFVVPKNATVYDPKVFSAKAETRVSGSVTSGEAEAARLPDRGLLAAVVSQKSSVMSSAFGYVKKNINIYKLYG